MDGGELCPSGTEITTENGCDDALKWASELGISLQNRKQLVAGSWTHVPHQCSYQSQGDQAFHFNNKQVENARDFLNGWYKMICRKGSTFVF